jgi:hypothetical protein
VIDRQNAADQSLFSPLSTNVFATGFSAKAGGKREYWLSLERVPDITWFFLDCGANGITTGG